MLCCDSSVVRKGIAIGAHIITNSILFMRIISARIFGDVFVSVELFACYQLINSNTTRNMLIKFYMHEPFYSPSLETFYL